jgi:hypothetical protein
MLKAVGAKDNVVTITNANGDASINFPQSEVFNFDPSLFSALADAFQRSDVEGLATLWQKARRFDSRALA